MLVATSYAWWMGLFLPNHQITLWDDAHIPDKELRRKAAILLEEKTYCSTKKKF